MKELAPIDLPIELTDAELDVVSGGYSVSVQSIAFFGLNLGGGTTIATADSVISSGGEVAAVASGIQGLMVTF